VEVEGWINRTRHTKANTDTHVCTSSLSPHPSSLPSPSKLTQGPQNNQRQPPLLLLRVRVPSNAQPHTQQNCADKQHEECGEGGLGGRGPSAWSSSLSISTHPTAVNLEVGRVYQGREALGALLRGVGAGVGAGIGCRVHGCAGFCVGGLVSVF